MSIISKPAVDQLRERVRAEVITADDPGYEDARTVHNGHVRQAPDARDPRRGRAGGAGQAVPPQ